MALNEYLDITKNEVKAKKYCTVTVNLEEYKKITEEIIENGSDKDLVLNIHGFFEIVFPYDLNSIQMTLPYNVNLYKTDTRVVDGNSKELILTFNPGDIIFTATYKHKNTSIDTLNALFENRFKYISDDIYELLLSIYTQLSGVSNVDFFNIELILSQVFAEKQGNKLVPLRLTSKQYSKKYAIDTQKSSHDFNNIMGFSYGYTNNYLNNKLTKDNKKDNSYLENIITNKYSVIENKEKDI